MICAALFQPQALRRADVQHCGRPRLDRHHAADQHAAARGEEPPRTHGQLHPLQGLRQCARLRPKGLGAGGKIRPRAVRPAADAEAAAKVENLCREARFLPQPRSGGHQLREDGGVKALVHAQIAERHTKAKRPRAARVQTGGQAAQLRLLHPRAAHRRAHDRAAAYTQRPLLPQKQHSRFRREGREDLRPVQHKDGSELPRQLLCRSIRAHRRVGDRGPCEAAGGGEPQLAPIAAERAAARAAQDAQHGRIRVHPDREARQKPRLPRKSRKKSLHSSYKALFVIHKQRRRRRLQQRFELSG